MENALRRRNEKARVAPSTDTARRGAISSGQHALQMPVANSGVGDHCHSVTSKKASHAHMLPDEIINLIVRVQRSWRCYRARKFFQALIALNRVKQEMARNAFEALWKHELRVVRGHFKRGKNSQAGNIVSPLSLVSRRRGCCGQCGKRAKQCCRNGCGMGFASSVTTS